MNSKPIPFVALIAVLMSATATAADLCDVPAAERQPIEALQRMLESQGWEIKKIKTDRGCYEAYATTGSGQRVEAYFNPKTFELIKKL